jgi:hypothetical protein
MPPARLQCRSSPPPAPTLPAPGPAPPRNPSRWPSSGHHPRTTRNRAIGAQCQACHRGSDPPHCRGPAPPCLRRTGVADRGSPSPTPAGARWWGGGGRGGDMRRRSSTRGRKVGGGAWMALSLDDGGPGRCTRMGGERVAFFLQIF